MHISPRLAQIKKSVQTCERQFMARAGKTRISPGGWGSFYTHGARKPGYGATPPERLLIFFDQVTRTSKGLINPDQHFADLGSGLGMASFTAAQIFTRVTGFEFDPRLSLAAEQIRQKFGVFNIQFLNRDFLQANLKHFDVIYLYYPFLERFADVMGEKLTETKPGTIIISRDAAGPRLFSPINFRQIYPAAEKHSIDLVLHEMFAYVRQ